MTPFDSLKPRRDRGFERRGMRNKKADVAEHFHVFAHAGLLVNEPPGQAGLPFV